MAARFRSIKAISSMSMIAILAFIVVVAAVGAYFFWPAPVEKREIKIGIIFPMTGAFSPFGTSCTNGMLLAIKNINDEGGVKGYEITPVVGDSQSNPDVAVSEAERMITVENVDIVTGAYASSLAMAVSTVCEDYGTIYYESIAAPNVLTLNRNATYIFRYAPMGLDYGFISAKFLVEYLCPAAGWDPEELNIAIVQEDSPWGESCSDGVEQKLAEYGLSLVVRERYSSKTTDLSALITSLKALDPDIVFATSYTADAALFIRQSSELGFRPKALIGHSAGYETYATVQSVGEKMVGIFTVGFPLFAVSYAALSPTVAAQRQAFLTAYQSEYGVLPDHWATLAYTAIYHALKPILETAIDRYGGISTENIRKAFYDVDVPDGGTFKIHGFKVYPEGHVNRGHNMRATLCPVCQWLNTSTNGFVAVWPADLAVQEPIVPPPLTW